MASRKVLALSAGLAVTGLLLTSCGDDTEKSTSSTTAAATATTGAAATTTAAATKSDIVGIALTANVFSQLAGLVVDAGLVDTLRSAGPFTVFAPPDSAFDKVPVATLHAVEDDKKTLTAVLTYHVVAGKLTTADLKDGSSIKTVNGAELKITKQGKDTYVNGAKIVMADIEASNGIVQVVDSVLIPPS